MGASADTKSFLLPDAGPLITLAYAGQLDLLLCPGWSLRLIDIVLHEVTRNVTPSRDAIFAFVTRHHIPVLETATFRHYRKQMTGASSGGKTPRKAGLGELALQEAITRLVLLEPPQPAVLLFEDHKIARSGFYLLEGSVRVSTRVFLDFLEKKAGWIPLPMSNSPPFRQVVNARDYGFPNPLLPFRFRAALPPVPPPPHLLSARNKTSPFVPPSASRPLPVFPTQTA
jgi:hypothetical protein